MIDINTHSVLAVLSQHIGAAKGVSVRDLAIAITGDGCEAYQRQVRDAVVHLRRDGYHVCAHPKSGYYLAADAADLDATCRFLVSRAMTSLAQVAAMRRVAMPDLYGQLNIPHELPTSSTPTQNPVATTPD